MECALLLKEYLIPLCLTLTVAAWALVAATLAWRTPADDGDHVPGPCPGCGAPGGFRCTCLEDRR